MKEETTEKNGIYKANIQTSKTVRMSKHQAMGFQREGDHLYYVSDRYETSKVSIVTECNRGHLFGKEL